ncbi:MAG: LytTR family DNA-binding domain-containing protein, partial [Bacteroidota bacterium]
LLEVSWVQAAVKRATQQLHFTHTESLKLLKETIKTPESLPKRLSLHTHDKIIVVEIEQIIRCESEDNNTRFFLAKGEKIFVTKTLKQYDQMLQAHHFMRTHQSHLVNLNYVQEFIKKDGGYLKMKNGDKVPVSVRKRQQLLQWLEQ